MKYILFSTLFLLNAIAIIAQPVLGPDGNIYDNDCIVPMLDGNGTVIFYFNDPDGDCISNDWISQWQFNDGSNEIRPGNGDTFDFNHDVFNCCPPPDFGNTGGGNSGTGNTGGNNTGNSSDNCDCTWSSIGDIIIIDCPCDPV